MSRILPILMKVTLFQKIGIMYWVKQVNSDVYLLYLRFEKQ